MKRLRFAAALIAAISTAAPAHAAKLVARIDISSQRMTVEVDGTPQYTWSVSTARRGYWTPTGTFRPKRMERVWYSDRFDDAPMPHSIFFLGGYAVHGTDKVSKLGRPASAGCIRLAPGNAAKLFAMVKRYGKSSTLIVVTR